MADKDRYRFIAPNRRASIRYRLGSRWIVSWTGGREPSDAITAGDRFRYRNGIGMLMHDLRPVRTAAPTSSSLTRPPRMASFGVVLEIRAVNLNRWFSLNLSGMTIKNLGWQPSSE